MVAITVTSCAGKKNNRTPTASTLGVLAVFLCGSVY